MNSSSSLTKISALDLRRAADIKDRIESLESELNNILALGGGVSSPTPKRSTGSGISAAGLARIRAAQKVRWARFHATKGKAKGKAPASAPKRRTMSPAARAKIAAAARARWRKAKAAGRTAL